MEPTQLGGRCVGGLGHSVPKEVMYPDMVKALEQMGYPPMRYDYLMQRGVLSAPQAQRPTSIMEARQRP
jgi:hypothetical protein